MRILADFILAAIASPVTTFLGGMLGFCLSKAGCGLKTWVFWCVMLTWFGLIVGAGYLAALVKYGF